MSETRLIVGLGNPGNDYEYTRHNLGFLVIRALVDKLQLKLSLSRVANGLVAEGMVEDRRVCLLMPLTYMNNSGVAVKQMASVNGLTTENILVVCDDFNLDFQQIRLRAKGSDGGHNGLSSVIEHLKTDQFARLRMGVGKPRDKKDIVDYVLEQFSKKEKISLGKFIDQATLCCVAWLNNGIEAAMDQYNRKV